MPTRQVLAFLILGLFPGVAVRAEQPRAAASSFVLAVQGDRPTNPITPLFSRHSLPQVPRQSKGGIT